MTSYAIRSCSEPPASMRWLAQQFPHRARLIADLQGRISRAPAAIRACAPEPDRFGQAMERTLALDLCDTPPYLQLIKQLPAAGMRRLLTTAGYAPIADTADGPWGKTSNHIPGARLFTVGSLLPYLDRAAHELRSANPDEVREAIQAMLRDRRAITAYATAASAARPAFAAFWASYMSGFHSALRGYGPVTASLRACFTLLSVGCVEGEALLVGGGFASGKAAEHATEGGPSGHGLRRCAVGFVVACQAAVGGDPGQGPLHDPAARVHDEPSLVGGFADDLDGGA
ncbi:hypothetical protein [Micromonospora zamorensis]|uniref:hypothetical protein n=1 Tax=Micromonospora zamorensis TaxID=709883 RepID=UPI001E61BB6C|nr:hypothetical protein [Micromonospora zamorensis]